MTESRPTVRPILYLPNLAAYRDRASLFGQVIRDAGGEGALVTSRLDVDPSTLGLDDINLVLAPPRWRAPGRSMFGASRTVASLLREGDYNVVHDTFGHLIPVMLRKKRYPGTKFVTSLYLLPEWDLRSWYWPRYHLGFLKYKNLRSLIMRSLTQRALARLADAVVVQAPGLVDRFVEKPGIDRSRVDWIPNNISDPRESPIHAPAADSPITLLFVGGFSVVKGGDKVLSLLGQARSAGIDLRLRVLGGISPVDRAHIESRIRNENLQDLVNIQQRVPENQVGEAYASADWLFHVTESDGSPRVVLEALIRGLPVIGSHHPGVRVVDPDEQFILFSDPWEPDAVLEILTSARSEPLPYRQRSEAGQEYVRGNFSVEAVAPRYVELYSRLLSNWEGHV